MDTVEKLSQAIRDYSGQEAIESAQEALASGIDPLKILDTITSALTEIGNGFSSGDLFLPDLIAGANTAIPVLPIVEEAILKSGVELQTAGVVVIGTVKGDVHDIGKSIVSALLTAHGFKVFDLGTDVPVERFIENIQNHRANVLALSSLLTTTSVEQGRVIDAVEAAGLRDKLKIVVGGGAINAEFAKAIGADGYAETAADGVRLVKSLLAPAQAG